jgi:hypothetical protein
MLQGLSCGTCKLKEFRAMVQSHQRRLQGSSQKGNQKTCEESILRKGVTNLNALCHSDSMTEN